MLDYRIEKEDDGTFTVFYKNKSGESSVKAGIVMFGTGRKPNTHNIGLEVSAACASICQAHACWHASIYCTPAITFLSRLESFLCAECRSGEG